MMGKIYIWSNVLGLIFLFVASVCAIIYVIYSNNEKLGHPFFVAVIILYMLSILCELVHIGIENYLHFQAIDVWLNKF